jgi:hypothetical protein
MGDVFNGCWEANAMRGSRQSRTRKEKGQLQPRHSPVISRALRILRRRYRGHKGETEHQTNERMMARWARRVGIFTIVLAIVSAISAGIFFHQMTAMQGQLNTMQEVNRDTHAALVDVQRAFVYLKEIG